MSEKNELNGYEEQQGVDYWNPETPGDYLEGIITKVEDGMFGKVFELEVRGEKIRTPSHKILQNKLNKAAVGDKCKIIFRGKGTPKARGENAPMLYDVGLIKEGVIPEEAVN